MSQKNRIPYVQALDALQPFVRFFEAAERVREVVERGASLEQAIGETEVQLAAKRAELEGFTAQIEQAHVDLATVREQIDERRKEFGKEKAALSAELEALQRTRTERQGDLQAIEARIEEARQKITKMLA